MSIVILDDAENIMMPPTTTPDKSNVTELKMSKDRDLGHDSVSRVNGPRSRRFGGTGGESFSVVARLTDRRYSFGIFRQSILRHQRVSTSPFGSSPLSSIRYDRGSSTRDDDNP
jgi:hypothetical protein